MNKKRVASHAVYVVPALTGAIIMHNWWLAVWVLLTCLSIGLMEYWRHSSEDWQRIANAWAQVAEDRQKINQTAYYN